MQTNWVARKSVDADRIAKLFEEPLTTNQFTNGGAVTHHLEGLIRRLYEIDDTMSVIAVCNGSAAIHVLTSAIAD